MDTPRNFSLLIGTACLTACAIALFWTLTPREMPHFDVGSMSAPTDASRVTQALVPGGVGKTASMLLRDYNYLDSLGYRDPLRAASPPAYRR